MWRFFLMAVFPSLLFHHRPMVASPLKASVKRYPGFSEGAIGNRHINTYNEQNRNQNGADDPNANLDGLDTGILCVRCYLDDLLCIIHIHFYLIAEFILFGGDAIVL